MAIFLKFSSLNLKITLKMSRKTFLLFVLVFASFSWKSNSQEDKDSINSRFLSQQFDYLMEKSEDYKKYHVIPTEWVKIVKSNTLDSLSTSKEKEVKQVVLLNNQGDKIAMLKERILALEAKNKDVQSNFLFGLPIDKTTHSLATYVLIFLLIASMMVFYIKNKKSKNVTSKVKMDLKELEEEFENHRRTAIEREQKVRRQLQDLINQSKGN
jgi:hypothetical protein